jgi:hypothetical protein
MKSDAKDAGGWFYRVMAAWEATAKDKSPTTKEVFMRVIIIRESGVGC